MVQVIPVILRFHTHGTGISAGIISDLYRDHICSAVLKETIQKIFALPFGLMTLVISVWVPLELLLLRKLSTLSLSLPKIIRQKIMKVYDTFLR